MQERKVGFAAIDPERQREIASLGGKAAQASGRARRFSSEEARAAGRKGGKAHSREHMAEIGRLGAQRRLERLRDGGRARAQRELTGDDLAAEQEAGP